MTRIKTQKPVKNFNRLALLFITHMLLFPNPAFSQKEWTLKKHKNGIEVYTKEHQNSSINSYKLQTKFKGSFEDVIAMVLDFNRYENWVKNCISSEILEKKGNDTIIYYSKFKTPWPASDRDFVNKVHVKYQEDDQVTITSTPSSYNVEKEDGVVRVVNYKDEWNISEINDSTVSMELEGFYDPGGSIPKWIVNLFIVDGPYQSVLKIKENADKTD